MPCYTITEVKLKLDNPNIDLLKKAIEVVTGIGNITDLQDSLTWNGGKYFKRTNMLSVPDKTVGKEIKRAYSAELVRAQAKRFGWSLKQVNQYKYQITKR